MTAGSYEASRISVSATLFRDACRRRQSRTRHREEQYTADRDRSTPTVHEVPQTGQRADSPRCINATACRARLSLRHRRDLHRPEQNTAAADFVGASGTPHSRQYRRPVASEPTAPIIQPYASHGQRIKNTY